MKEISTKRQKAEYTFRFSNEGKLIGITKETPEKSRYYYSANPQLNEDKLTDKIAEEAFLRLISVDLPQFMEMWQYLSDTSQSHYASVMAKVYLACCIKTARQKKTMKKPTTK